MTKKTIGFDVWEFNCTALLSEIHIWKSKFIKEQSKKHPYISDKSLIKKIKIAKEKKFRERATFLVRSHPVMSVEKE